MDQLHSETLAELDFLEVRTAMIEQRVLDLRIT
jgi:hypothetical protein